MVSVNKLRAKIVENGTNIATLSKQIGIDKATFYRKLKADGGEFTVNEVDGIARELHLTRDEVNAIFFSQFVA